MILPLQLLTLVFPLRNFHSPINELLNALALPKIYLVSLVILFVSLLIYGSVNLARLEIADLEFSSAQNLFILIFVGIVSYLVFSILFNRPTMKEVLSFVR
jgi:hypothetical protein